MLARTSSAVIVSRHLVTIIAILLRKRRFTEFSIYLLRPISLPCCDRYGFWVRSRELRPDGGGSGSKVTPQFVAGISVTQNRQLTLVIETNITGKTSYIITSLLC
jgi:hypothetical protein